MSTAGKDVSSLKTIIGLEIHCQLNTRSKLFCGCNTDFRESEPNTCTCEVCLGLPGSMPMVNKKAIEFAIKVGKALNCEILETSEFARKNYFYPDLPKAYQITQYDKPLAVQGYLNLDIEGQEKEIRITRVHVEEDPGRSVHVGSGDRARYTLVDYNRSGIPLIEIVTEPDLRSPKEARQFLGKLRATLEYLNVFDSEKEGSLRVDANISLEGSERVEVKNISSYKGVEKALTYEITRQRNMLRRGQKITRETRHYQETRGVTTSARSKEEEDDYRYFPEPDLYPMHVKSWAEDIELPELPDARRARFMKQYGCSFEHAKTLTGQLKLADFYEKVVEQGADASLASTWIADILLGELNYRDMNISQVPTPTMSELLSLLSQQIITDANGVEVLRIALDDLLTMIKSEKIGSSATKTPTPKEIVSKRGLAKVAGDEISEMIELALDENPQAISDYRAGKGQALNFLVGQVMKLSKGRADPGELNAMLSAAIEKRGL
ncbi:MAG: Asp-tRNA(Asn)/Glu-tRNA(Gln) amidotransferase subunit GatB [Methanomicrobiales archaeon]|jgi:aspartyl-tRNA(Asn)/glutamyl-tRNA(Gln) amidotransferase subunit B|nr:Asp-tRNA(Asn)/Glu-tRNA(Gln) amidotransferase subunit GatB [Methanomicrobiales archaeon]